MQAAPLLQHFIAGRTAGARMWKVSHRKPDIADVEGAAPPQSLSGAITLRNIRFAYPARCCTAKEVQRLHACALRIIDPMGDHISTAIVCTVSVLLAAGQTCRFSAISACMPQQGRVWHLSASLAQARCCCPCCLSPGLFGVRKRSLPQGICEP